MSLVLLFLVFLWITHSEKLKYSTSIAVTMQIIIGAWSVSVVYDKGRKNYILSIDFPLYLRHFLRLFPFASPQQITSSIFFEQRKSLLSSDKCTSRLILDSQARNPGRWSIVGKLSCDTIVLGVSSGSNSPREPTLKLRLIQGGERGVIRRGRQQEGRRRSDAFRLHPDIPMAFLEIK